jgi:hypothetical protein
MPSAIDRAKQIAVAVGKKHTDYSFKAVMTDAKIQFVDIEIWRNVDRRYVGSDIRSQRFYNELTREGVEEVVNSIASLIKQYGKR